MTLKERMFYLIEKEGINPNQFYTKSGLGNGYLDKIGDSFRKPTIEKIKKSFPHWNIDWILQEKGEPFQPLPASPLPPVPTATSDTSVAPTPPPRPVKVLDVAPLSPDHVLYVPLVTQYAYAGYLCGYADEEYIETLPTVPFIVDKEAHGNYVSFEVKGDSMDDGTDDAYKEGDRLLCREILPQYWIQSTLHIRKWDFVIVHEEGILMKRIIHHDLQNHTITIHSLNSFYPDRVIDLREVRQIFNVIELQRIKRR